MNPATASGSIRVLRATLLALVAALFAQGYSAALSNQYVFAAGIGQGALPTPCHFFLRYALLGYAIPAATLALGFLALRRKGAGSPALELVLSASYVSAALWAAACVLAWFLPGYVPQVEIR